MTVLTFKGQYPLLTEDGCLTVLVPAEDHDFQKDWSYPLSSVCRECGEWRMTSDLLYPEDLADNTAPVKPTSRAGLVTIPRSNAPTERATRERVRSTEFERTWRPMYISTDEGLGFTYRNRVTGEYNPKPPRAPS